MGRCANAGRAYRVVVKRQQVDISEGQEYLFTEYRQRFVITDIPKSHMDPAEVFCFAYGRCDQENFIEQFKNGIAAMRMPAGELLANGAFLMAGQLAWCLRSWLSALALPKETTRWEWKWFRHPHLPPICAASTRSIWYCRNSFPPISLVPEILDCHVARRYARLGWLACVKVRGLLLGQLQGAGPVGPDPEEVHRTQDLLASPAVVVRRYGTLRICVAGAGRKTQEKRAVSPLHEKRACSRAKLGIVFRFLASRIPSSLRESARARQSRLAAARGSEHRNGKRYSGKDGYGFRGFLRML